MWLFSCHTLLLSCHHLERSQTGGRYAPGSLAGSQRSKPCCSGIWRVSTEDSLPTCEVSHTDQYAGLKLGMRFSVITVVNAGHYIIHELLDEELGHIKVLGHLRVVIAVVELDLIELVLLKVEVNLVAQAGLRLFGSHESYPGR